MRSFLFLLISALCFQASAHEFDIFDSGLQDYCTVAGKMSYCLGLYERDKVTNRPRFTQFFLHPELINPREILSWNGDFYAIDEQGLSYSRKKMPFKDAIDWHESHLKNPRKMKLYGARSNPDRGLLVLHDEGLSLFPPAPVNKDERQDLAFPFQNANAVIKDYDRSAEFWRSGMNLICAISESELSCIDLESRQEILHSPLRGGRSVAVDMSGSSFAQWTHEICVADADGLKCWGRASYQGKIVSLPVPQFSEAPTVVSLHLDSPCAIVQGQVKCWKLSEPDQVTTIPDVQNPRKFLGNCVVDDNGVQCWNLGGSLQRFTSYGYYTELLHFSLPALDVYFDALQNTSTAARAKYFSSVRNLLKILPEIEYQDSRYRSSGEFYNWEARELLIALISPAILSGDSDFYRQKLIPAFYEASGFAADKNSAALKAQSVSDYEWNRQMTLGSLQAALNVSQEFMQLSERASVQKIIKLIGEASTDPRNDDKIRFVTTELKTLLPQLKQRLSTSGKSVFLFEVIRLPLTYLEKVAP